MAVTISEVPVDFHGAGAGTGALTWGQLQIWHTVRDTGRTMNIVTAGPLPDGTPLAEMTAFLRFMVSRHPVLRSTLRSTGDPRPCQVLVSEGVVPLQIVDIGDDDDPLATAEDLRARYELTWFDHEHEFPVRMGVVRQSDELRAVALGFSHVMVDGAALAVLTRDTGNLDRATGAATAPVTGLNLLELAGVQGGPVGRRQTERCMRYWESQLRRLGTWRGGPPAVPHEPRFRELVMYSPAMELGLRAIEARTRVGSTYALLAAYAVAVARVMGRNPGVAQLVVSNRFRPGFADAVLQLSQPGLCVVDAAAATFDEVVDRAQKAATAAAFHAYYDPLARDALLARVEAETGGPLDISWHVNDRRALSAPAGDEAAGERAVRAAVTRTRLFWDRSQPTFNGSLFMQVDAQPDATLTDRVAVHEGPALWIELWTDTHRFATGQIEALVREMETVVVDAAFDGSSPTGVR